VRPDRAELGVGRLPERAPFGCRRLGRPLRLAEGDVCRVDLCSKLGEALQSLYGGAVDLLPVADATYPDLLYELARVLSMTERRKESVEIFQRARDLARQRGDLRTDWLSRLALSTTLMSVDPHAVVTAHFREEIQEAIGIFESLGDERAQARAWLQLAETEWMPCRYGEALAWLTHALEIARRAEDRQTVDEVTEMMVGAMYFGPTPAEEALDRITEMLKDAQLTPLSRGVVTAVHGGIQARWVSLTRRWKTMRQPIGSSGTSDSRRFC